MSLEIHTRESVAAMLRAHGVNPTHQRIEIAYVLFEKRQHLSADQILADAGYIKRPKPTLPGATRYLATKFGLDQSQVTSTLQYLAFLQSQKKEKRALKR